MPARRALLLSLFLLLFLLPLTIVASKRPVKNTSRGATEAPRLNKQGEGSNEPQYVKNEIIVKFKEPKRVVEDDRVKTFRQLDQISLPSSITELNQFQEIKSIEKVFKTVAPMPDLGQKAPPSENVNPDADKVFKITFAKEIEPVTVIRELMRNSEVEYTEPNYIYKTSLTPNDPYFLDHYPDNVGNRDPNWNPPYDYQWNLKKIKLDQAYDLEKEGESVLVAVIDSGIDYTHPDFGACSLEQVNTNHCPKITPGWNFVKNTSDPKDDNLHGTHVAGIINALTNNNLGMAGFDKGLTLRVIPIKGLDQNGEAPADLLASAIDFAVRAGAKVINMSWGGSGESLTLHQAIEKGLAKDIIFIAAAGNESADVADFFPAAMDGVIAVSATDEKDTLASYSNYGSQISVSAPGGSREYNLLSLAPTNIKDLIPKENYKYIVGGVYLRIAGTSMAAPHVAALAALIKSLNSNLSNQEVQNIIFNSADDLGTLNFDNYYGYGRINAYKALSQMNASKPPVARITKPIDKILLGRKFTVSGRASGQNFENYSLTYSYSPQCDKDNSGFSHEGVTIDNPNREAPANALLAEVTLPSPLPDGTANKYCLKLTVRANQKETFTVSRFFLDKTIALGWPVDKGGTGGMTGRPTVGDINNDGEKEVVIFDSGDAKIYAFDKQGRNLPNFPINTPHQNFNAPSTVSLSSQNLFAPILISDENLEAGYRWVIAGWNGTTGEPLKNWQVSDWGATALGPSPDSVTLQDLDQDGVSEIIYAEMAPRRRGEPSRVYAFNQQRLPLPGWEDGVKIPLTENHISSMYFPPSAADQKIALIHADYKKGNFYHPVRRVAVFGPQGQIISDFSIKISEEAIIRNLALGDVDHDNQAEIVILFEDGDIEFKVSLWETSGEKTWEYAIPHQGDPDIPDFAEILVLADFNNDQYPEIFTCNDKAVCVILDGQGKPLPGFPTLSESPFAPSSFLASAVKLKNGNFLILQNRAGDEKLGIWAVEYNPRDGKMSVPQGFPKYLNPSLDESLRFRILPDQPIAADLEGDGKLELIVTTAWALTRSYTYTFNTGLELATNGLEWPQYRNDAGHTGAYHPAQAPPPPCRTCENFTGCLVGKTCMQICQTNPDQCESQPCRAGTVCNCRAGAPEEYRCPN